MSKLITLNTDSRHDLYEYDDRGLGVDGGDVNIIPSVNGTIRDGIQYIYAGKDSSRTYSQVAGSAHQSLEVITANSSSNKWLQARGKGGDWINIGGNSAGAHGVHFSNLDKSVDGWMVYWDPSHASLPNRPIFPQQTTLQNGATAPTNTTYTTSTTQIATTAFVQNAINRRIPTTLNISGSAASAVSAESSRDFSLWTAPAAGRAIFYCRIGVLGGTITSAHRFSVTITSDGETQASRRKGCKPSPTGWTYLSVASVNTVSSGTKLGAQINVLSGNYTQYNAYIVGILIRD